MSRGTPALVGWLAFATLLLVMLFTAVVLIGGLAPDDNKHGLIGQVFKTAAARDRPGHDRRRHRQVAVPAGDARRDARRPVRRQRPDRRDRHRPRRPSSRSCARAARSCSRQDHTLILGWSDTIFTILSELEIANESEKRPGRRRPRRSGQGRDGGRDPRQGRPPGRTRVVCRRAARSTSPTSRSPARRRRARSSSSPPERRGARRRRSSRPCLPSPRAPATATATTTSSPRSTIPPTSRRRGLVGGDEAVMIDKRRDRSRGSSCTPLASRARRWPSSSCSTSAATRSTSARTPALDGRTFGDALLAYEDCSRDRHAASRRAAWC